MKRLLQLFIDRYFNKNLHFRVRLFNFLALGGIVVSIVASITSAINGEPILSSLMNFIGAPISLALMHYASKTGKYERCYILTIIVVFLIIFPVIYFSGGGYKGAMPSFFVFAALFTVFMLDGKKAILFSLIELAVYVSICIYSFNVPGSFVDFVSPFAEFWDTVFGFTIAGAALVFSLMIHFKLYNEQQRELEAAKLEAEKFSEAKSTFLANMSHEIRTPINVILGLNEMISRESDSRQVTEYSAGIENAGKTLLSLISNVLDMSKIEAGKLQSVTETYSSAKLISELSAFGAELAGRKGLSFHAEVDDNLPSELIGSYEYIKQVVLNLLGNAAKYTEEGGVVLSIACAVGDNEDEIIMRISVRDTGIGITESDIAILFDTFTRANTAVTGGIEGAGLGLSISKELTRFMGGDISVKSVYGEGSVFTAEFPQKIADKTPVSALTDYEKSNIQKRTGSFIAPEATLLAVDDNQDNLTILRLLLSRTMIKLDTATSGEKCIEAVKNKQYNAIIMDYMMPGMDGIETLRLLSEIPGFDTPVIALTAVAGAKAEEKLKTAGFALCLTKPIIWKDLEAALVRIIPSELITAHTFETSDDAMPQSSLEAARLLENFGVFYGDGLAFLSGDKRQYIKIAGVFIENSKQCKNAIEALASENNFTQLLYEAHSLKSKARAIGANILSDTALKLENLCAVKDEQHIKLLLPILYYEWERANKGLTEFCKTAEAYIAADDNKAADSVKLEDLMPLLRRNRQPDALELIEKLLANKNEPQTEEALLKIREKINDVEFREAEKLLYNLIEEVSDEREKSCFFS